MIRHAFLEFELGTSLASEFDEDGFLGVQVDGHGEQGLSAFELHHTYGFSSRPLDPSDGACTTLFAWKGNEGFAWLANDPRVTAKLPQIKKGESYQYGATGNFVRCHADGIISIFTTDDATPNGKSVYQQFRPDGFRTIAPWGSIRFDATGYHLKHVSDARIDLGAIGGLPSPLSALSSSATIKAALIKLEGSAIVLGSTGGTPEPVAKATTTLAVLSSISTALGLIDAALVAMGKIPTIAADSSSLTAIGAATTGIAAAVTVISAAAATLPSASTQVT